MHEIHAVPILGFREPFNCLSHAVGACIFAALAIKLIRRGRGDRTRMISLAVMAYASIQTLVLSTIYHMHWPGPFREIMLRADVAGIFLLMAGSFTPVHAILFRGAARSVPLVLVWTVALGGMLLRMIYFDRLTNLAGILIFLALGWGGAVTAAVVWYRFGWKFIRLGVFAGLAYTISAISLLLHRPMIMDGFIGPHELWHLAVLCGLGLHWNFVFHFASGVHPGMEIWGLRRVITVGPPQLAIVHGEQLPTTETLPARRRPSRTNSNGVRPERKVAVLLSQSAML